MTVSERAIVAIQVLRDDRAVPQYAVLSPRDCMSLTPADAQHLTLPNPQTFMGLPLREGVESGIGGRNAFGKPVFQKLDRD